MKQKRALELTVILAVLAVVLLLTTTIVKKVWPSLGETGPQRVETGPKTGTGSDQLPLQEEDIQKVKTNNLKVPAWKAESVIPTYHNSNLALYSQRSKNQEALSGVTVFLDPALGGNEQGYVMNSGLAATDPVKRVFTAAELNLNLAYKIQAKLEALGAKVILIRAQDMPMSDTERVARLAHYLIGDFLEELKEQNFKSDRLVELRQAIGQEIAKKHEANYSSIFTKPGSGQDLRLILDLEKQYQEMFYLRINHLAEVDNNSQRGFHIRILKPVLSAAEGSAEAPAYMNYETEGSRRLADILSTELIKIIPDLKNSDQTGIEEGLSDILRQVNIKALEFSPGYLSNGRDLALLLNPERQETIGEAVANAVYLFLSEQTVAETEPQD